MMTIEDYVKNLQSHHGMAPKPNPVLRAIIAAWLLYCRLLGVSTVTQACILTNSSRPSIEAALTIIKAEDEHLLASVLGGRHLAAKRRRPGQPAFYDALSALNA